MANSGTKFASVNLNKSYGQSSYSNHSSFGGSYAQSAAARARPGGGGGGGGGGMVVLSRPRSSQKTGPKLSVPPPLNLPSLRKEHERFDSSGSGGVAGGTGGPGAGARPTSSGLGWTKPAPVVSEEKDGRVNGPGVESVDGASKGNVAYTPPLARSSGTSGPLSGTARAFPSAMEKTSVLRGEDFPSLHAALPVSTGSMQKQKDGISQKQKQTGNEELSYEQRDDYHMSALVDMRPKEQPVRCTVGNSSIDNGGEYHRLADSRMDDRAQKQEDYFPDPLALVRLNPRSDWADDERDTGHRFSDRGRGIGYAKCENRWDRDFDMPRASALPHKPVYNHYERLVQGDDEAGKIFPSEFVKVDLHHRAVRMPSREGRQDNNWRTTEFPKDQEVANDRNNVTARTSGLNRDTRKENKYIPPRAGDMARDGGITRNQGYPFGRRDMIHVSENWNHKAESINGQGVEGNARDRYSTEHGSRYRGDGLQNPAMSKSSFISGRKASDISDSIVTLGPEKRGLSKSEMLYEDPFPKGFGSPGYDDTDPFAGGLRGVVKRKKDITYTDFHDPVRESFEAELERVQKMQELERQRIVEEQERAREQARREEEEKQRLIREEEERLQRLKQEAQQAAWRAEQERLEAIRSAEEQKTAREEERRRMLMEEERRKQAAKQKLLELEAKIAKREAEAAKVNGPVGTAVADKKLPAATKEKDVSGAMDFDNWEESERMVERITTSASFDASGSNRGYEMSSRPNFAGECSLSVPESGISLNSWRRDVFEYGGGSSSAVQDLEIGHYSPRQDALASGGVIPRKDFYGGGGYISSESYVEGEVHEPCMDEFGRQRDHKWNFSGDGDSYHRNRGVDSEFRDNLLEKYGEVGWGQGRYHGNTRPPHTEADDLYSYGRSRYSMRQPRVLPPPLAPVQRTSFRGANKHPGPSTFLDNDNHYAYAARSESTRTAGFYGSHEEGLEALSLVDVCRENSEIENQKLNTEVIPHCDSQSSLSVLSPPNSPPHLSHDESDESRDFPVTPPAIDGNNVLLSGNQSIITSNAGKEDTLISASSSMSVVEDEEWTVRNIDELREQEEYDEDEDGYQVEDEVRERENDNIDLNQELEDLHLEEKDSSHMVDNLVLGFDDGVEVKIPCDDFERNSRSDEIGVEASEPPLENQGSIRNVQGDGQNFRLLDGSSRMSRDSSSGKIRVSEKVTEDSLTQPTTSPYTSMASDVLLGVDVSSSSGTSSQQTVSSLSDTPTSTGQTTTSSSSEVDLPVKLQFGLFSGPSLIPSPIPAIQIGSIQMPLHFHPAVGPSLTHMHSLKPPFFQFGQLGYSSSISHGLLPMAPQSMSFVQPNVQAHCNPSQDGGGSLHLQPSQDTPKQNLVKEDLLSIPVSKHAGFSSEAEDQSDVNVSKKSDSVSVGESVESSFLVKASGAVGDKIPSEPVSLPEHKGQSGAKKNFFRPVKERVSDGQSQAVQAPNRPLPSEKNIGGLRAQGPSSSSKGRRFAYAVKNSGLRSNFPAHDSSGFQRRPRRIVQRTEFRIRENGDKRQLPGSVSVDNSGLDEKSNFSGRAAILTARSGSKRGTISRKESQVVVVESDNVASVNINSQEVDSGNLAGKEILKNGINKSQIPSFFVEGNLKRNISEEGIDAPLHSGVVQVFKQPGIDAPSDEDDFIQVRSKRQMLNDRREQREREIKAKSRFIKPPRKPRASTKSHGGSTNLYKIFASVEAGGQNANSGYVASRGRGLANKEFSVELATVSSQPPIGTPAVNFEPQADRKAHVNISLLCNNASNVSSGGKDPEAGVMLESKNKIVDNVPVSLKSWGATQISQQVMDLTQTQLEEAMKLVQFDAHISSVGGHISTVTEPTFPSSSILVKEKFSSSASPISSLLAGEKIQFGAVTSPTVLPPSSCAVSNGIGAPGSIRDDMQISQNLSAAEAVLFIEKDKNTSNSSVIQDCEAESEAEAAASAVAVAAITGDDAVGHEVGSGSVSGTKSFEGADIDGITSGMAGDQQLSCQSRAEDSLAVSLPADLSVETPPISLWLQLPSPHNSSQVLSHFPRGPPSHFPFYELNPMLGGPIFAFGPREESSSNQSQLQKNTPSSSEPPSSWQHSMVDSFYGPPAGFTGPFISPPGGIPGVQGPPHMVVYNHFTPVGQFGQVGLSYMGTTYIPSGKQPDWKHNPTSSTVGIGEGEMNNLNIASSQHSTTNMPAPIQHLAPGSQLLRMASPVAMFDMSPFQSAPDMSVQAHWSQIPASPFQSAPSSRPLQQHVEGVFPLQFGAGHLVDQSLNANKFPYTQSSISSSNAPSFTVAADINVSRFPDELGVGDLSSSTTTGVSAHSAACQSSSGNANVDASKNDSIRDGLSNNSMGENSGSLRSLSSSHHRLASGQQSQSSGYSYQRGGVVSQRNPSGNEWSYRRTGYHSRNQSFNSEKGFSSTKVKQIYVAKQTGSGT